MPAPVPANSNFVFTHRPVAETLYPTRPSERVMEDAKDVLHSDAVETHMATTFWEDLAKTQRRLWEEMMIPREILTARAHVTSGPTLSGMPVSAPLTDSIGRVFNWSSGAWRQTRAAPVAEALAPGAQLGHRRFDL